MASKTSVIFIDFDGVLHPTDYLRFDEFSGELSLTADVRFCWAKDLADLVSGFECVLVVHSSWRTSHTLVDIKAMLPPDLACRVIATTDIGPRFESIISYAEKHHLKEFLILDDDPDEFPDGLENLLICDSGTGVGDSQIQQRIRLFLEATTRGGQLLK